MPQAMKLFGETLQISKLDQQYMSKPAEAENDADSKNVSMKCWVGSNMKFVNIQNLIFQLMVSKHKDIITLLNGTAQKVHSHKKLTSSFLKKLASKLSTFQVVT